MSKDRSRGVGEIGTFPNNLAHVSDGFGNQQLFIHTGVVDLSTGILRGR